MNTICLYANFFILFSYKDYWQQPDLVVLNGWECFDLSTKFTQRSPSGLESSVALGVCVRMSHPGGVRGCQN